MRYADRNAWHPFWRLSLLLALLPCGALPAADYQLETRIGWSDSPMQSAFPLKHNSPEAVTAEVNDPAIRKALADAAAFKDFRKIQDIQLSVTSPTWHESTNLSRSIGSSYTLRYPTLEARSLFSKRLETEIEKYLRTRLLGHTREFALASLTNSNRGRTGMELSKAGLLNMYKEIPESWLQPWSESGKQVGYYVVDGELAWTFRLMGPVPWLQIADAQEFDPKLKETFAMARKKAEENLAARGIERRMGYVHYFWPELKKVLREEYKIQWRCPTDLNTSIYD